jgi:hypothetical protein
VFDVVVGGVASGVFVGVFWPTYYRIQRICGLDFSEWNVRDKIAGAFIVLLSGFSVDLLGVELVLIVSLVAILASGKYSMDLMGGHDGRWVAGSTSDVTPFRALSSLPALIAMTEGTFNWMASLTRLLVIMTGLLEVASLPAAVGLGLLLALTGAFGAGITWGVGKWMGESKSVGNKLVAFGLSISFASSLLLASEHTWKTIALPIERSTMPTIHVCSLANRRLEANDIERPNATSLLPTDLLSPIHFATPQVIPAPNAPVRARSSPKPTAAGRLATSSNPVIITSNLVKLAIQLNVPSVIAIRAGSEERARNGVTSDVLPVTHLPSWPPIKSMEYFPDASIATNDTISTSSTPNKSTLNPERRTINAPAILSLTFHSEKSNPQILWIR